MKTNKFLVAGFVLLLVPFLLFSMPYARYRLLYPTLPPYSYIYDNLGGTVESICTAEDFVIWAQTENQMEDLNDGEYWEYDWEFVFTYLAPQPPFYTPRPVWMTTWVTSINFSDIHNYSNKMFRCIVKKFSASGVELSSTGTDPDQWVTFHIDIDRNSIVSQPQDINGKCEGEQIILDFSVNEPIVECQWKRRLIGNTTWQIFSPSLDDPYYTFQATSADDDYEYVCEVTNGCGNILTNIIRLNLLYPPELANHPDNRSICEGTGSSFSVSMVNTSDTYIYQWQMRPSGGTWANVSGSNFSGTTTNELVVSNITNPYNNYQFRCYATSSCSPGAYSNAAALTVKANPVITSAPSTPTVCEEGSYSYTTSATGYSPLEYRWEKSAVVISDWSTNNQLQLNNIATAMAGPYNCYVKNECGTTNTTLINLNVTELPVIETISEDISICEGDDTPIGITVTFSGEIYNFIYEESTDGGTSWSELHTEPIPYYSLPVPTASMDGNQYRVIAIGSCEPSDTSDIVNLEVRTAPLIDTQPIPFSVCEGEAVTFDVEASGSAPLEYRWKKDGAVLVEWTETSSLQLGEVGVSDNGVYLVQIRNSCSDLSGIDSDVASLVVLTPPSVEIISDDISVCEGDEGSISTFTTGNITNIILEESTNTGIEWTEFATFDFTSSNDFFFTSITASMDGNQYRLIAFGDCEPSDTSDIINMEVKTIPVITTAPEDNTACEGENVTFNVEASGGTPMEYRWKKGGATIIDWSATSSLQLVDVSSFDADDYFVQIRNSCTGLTVIDSDVASLVVIIPPSIEIVSDDISVCEGDEASISTLRTGNITNMIIEESTNAGIEWTEFASFDITGNDFFFPSITASMDGNQYRVIAFGDCEPSDTSDIVNLEVKTIPVITTAPEDTTACEGENITFNVVASGSPTLEYRWKKGGSTLGDWSVTSSLLLEEVTTDDYDDYFVQIRNGCTGLNVIESDVVTLIVHPSPTVSLGADKHLCPGSSVELSPGTGYASYAWSTDETTSSITVSNGGNYEVTITDQNSCTNSDKILVIMDPVIPVLYLGDDIVECLGNDIILDASDDYDIYTWSNDKSSQTIFVTESGTYSVTVSRNISVCEESDEIQVDIFSPYEDEEICMISIEKESGKNMIIWEKTDDVGTEFFQVWRQTNVQDEYIMIHESAYGDESIFIDTETNPEVKSELYKIIVLDTCGNYSEASLSHKPMFLTSSLGANEDEINLAWTPYLIGNAEINFPSYIIYRGEGTGVLEPIDTIAAGAGTNLYTDANPPADIDLFYRIAGVKEDPCDPNNLLDDKKGESGPFIHSYSNLEDNRIKSTGLFNKSAASGLKLFPNPMTQETRIVLPENCSLPVIINIIDVNGRIMRSIISHEKDIVIKKENLTAGIYIVMVISENIMYDKLMIE